MVMAWGSSFLLITFALRDLDPFFITGARIALAATIVSVIARTVAGPFPAEARFWLWSAPIGIAALILPFSLYYQVPIWAVVFGVLLLGETLPGGFWPALVLILVGLAIAQFVGRRRDVPPKHV